MKVNEILAWLKISFTEGERTQGRKEAYVFVSGYFCFVARKMFFNEL